MADNFTDRMVAISDQKRYVDPYQQRVFQYDTEDSDVFLARVVNSLLRIFGDDVVINGFLYKDLQITHTDNDIILKETEGLLIQDNTMVEFNSPTTVNFTNLSGLDPLGRIVIYVRYNFLHTLEPNPAFICTNYISQTGSPRFDWDFNKDRTVIGILEFKKDENDKLISVFASKDTYIDISGKRYYLWGINPNKRELTTYLLRMVYKDVGSSITLNDGLELVGDIGDPGENRYYGTDETTKKGWYPFPAEFPPGTNFLQLTDTPNTYDMAAGKLVRVNSKCNGLEFIDGNLDTTKYVNIYRDEIIYSNKVLNGDLYILGNCNIKGSLTYIEQETLKVTSAELLLNTGELAAGVSAIFSGLRVKRGTLPDALLRFNEVNDRWEIGFEGDYPYKKLVVEEELNKIVDSGSIVEYKDIKYDMKLVNGNLILKSI